MEQAHYPKTTSSCIHSLLSDRAEHVSLTILHCTSVPYWLKSSWLRLSLCLAPPVLACALQTDKRHEEVAAFAVIGLRLYAVWNLCCAWNSPLRSGGVSAALEDYLQPCPGAQEGSGNIHWTWYGVFYLFARLYLLACVICRPAEERDEAVAAVAKKMPKRVKRKRPVHTEDGLEVGNLAPDWPRFIDLDFEKITPLQIRNIYI
eukprot:scaffold37472_cov22-Tisochrysis_lutea.AAC.1